MALADKLHNARSLLYDLRVVGPRLWDRFNAGPVETLWYYRTMIDVFRGVTPGPLVEELNRVVTDLEHLATVSVDGH